MLLLLGRCLFLTILDVLNLDVCLGVVIGLRLVIAFLFVRVVHLGGAPMDRVFPRAIELSLLPPDEVVDNGRFL